MTLIAEDLLLLLLDDEDGTLVQQSFVDQALAGAVLAELALEGHVVLGDPRGWGLKPHVLPAEGAAPDDEVLAEALVIVAERPRDAGGLLRPLGKGLRQRLAVRLVARGILRREEDKVLGLFPRTTWPTVDATHEADVRRDLAATLLDGVPPGPRTAAIIGLLHAIGRSHKTIDRGGVPAHEVRKRAKAVAEGDLASEAVSAAVQAMYTAVFTATVIPAVVAGSS